MVKTDYFVVVYRILSYLLDCFDAGERADITLFGPEAMGINNGKWANIIESIYNEGYVTGVTLVPSVGSAPSVLVRNIKITQKGIEFLLDNTNIQKAKRFLKEVKDVVPGF